jgi:hypothetical protein
VADNITNIIKLEVTTLNFSKKLQDNYTGENLFYNRIFIVRNSLPSEIMDVTTVSSFNVDINYWISSGRFN